MIQLAFANTMVAQSWVPLSLTSNGVLIDSLGWTLIHFLWQGLLIVGCTALLLNALRKATAQLRYLVACGGMLVAAVVPVVTFPILIQQALSQSTAWSQDTSQNSDSVSWVQSAASPRAQSQLPNPQGEGSQLAALSPSVAPRWESNRSLATIGMRWDLLLRFSVWGWTAGVLFYFVRLLGGLYKVHQWKKSCQPVADSAISRVVDELKRRMHINSAVELLESVRIVTPVAIGWVKPVILLPVELATGLNSKELEAILAHELAHIRRHDYLVNIFQSIIEIGLFYHPAVWWLSHQIRLERENCCDDAAIAVTEDRLAFARALSHLEGLRSSENQMVMAANGGLLLKRIQRIMQIETERSRVSVLGGFGWRVGASLLMVCLGVSVSYAAFVQQTGKVDESKRTNSPAVDANPLVAKSTAEVKPVRREDQPGVRVIVSHMYTAARRESTGWVEVDGAQVPVDVGILHDGVIVYLTLMYDVIAADIKEPKAIWTLDWNKGEPIWDVLSIVEVHVGEGKKELGVELFASDPNKQRTIYKYVSLKTGKELKPVGPQVEVMPPDLSAKNQSMFEVDATQADYRLARDGWSHVTGTRVSLQADLPQLKTANANVLPQNLKLRAQGATKVTDGTIEADSMRLSIAAGSKLQLELQGTEVTFSQLGERALARVVAGEVDIIVDSLFKAKLRGANANGQIQLDWRQTDTGYEMDISGAKTQENSASSEANLQLSPQKPFQQSIIMESGEAILQFQSTSVPAIKAQTASKLDQPWLPMPNRATAPSPARTDELLSSIVEMGDWNDSNKPSPFQSWRYMEIANRLLELSETERIKVMRELGSRELDGPLVVLCRMLIESRDAKPLRAPKFGSPLLLPGDYREGENHQLPLVFIRDMPLLVVKGYRLAGEKETALNYFEEMLAQGQWRTKRYDTSDEAIETVFNEIPRCQLWGDRVDFDEWNSIGELLCQLRPAEMIRIGRLQHVAIELPVFVMDDQGVSVEEIVNRLSERVPENERPTFIVLLHVDEDAKYEWVEDVINAIQSKGFSTLRISTWQRP
jgi:beta-lactamase regulating signal transducer with metallopeptidase domain